MVVESLIPTLPTVKGIMVIVGGPEEVGQHILGEGKDRSLSRGDSLPTTGVHPNPSTGGLNNEALGDVGSMGVDLRSPSLRDSAGAVPTSPHLKAESARSEALEWVARSLRDSLSKVSFTLTCFFFFFVSLFVSLCLPILTFSLLVVVGSRELMCWLTSF